MQGSIEHPPVIVQSSRGRMVVPFLLCAGMAGIGTHDWLSAAPPPPKIVLSTLFFFVGMLGAARMIIRPARLILSPEGLHYATLLRNQRFRWDEIGLFRVETISYRWRRVKMVKFDCHPRDPGKIYAVLLGGMWEIDNQSLVDLLDRTQARWIRPGGPAMSGAIAGPPPSRNLSGTPFLQGRARDSV